MESNKSVLEELIESESFQNYVLYQHERAKWEQWVKDNPEHHQDFQKASAFIISLKFKQRNIEQREVEQEIERFDKRIAGDNASGKVVPMWKRLIQVAAVVALVALFTYLGIHKDKPQATPELATVEMVEKKIPRGVKSQTRLPDGTLVKINSGSVIRYPSRFENNKRVVTLEGEAFFEVVSDKDKPFIVKAGGMTTIVLGTAFVINATRCEEPSVSLLEGSIKVKALGQQRVLTPGEQLLVHEKSLEVRPYDYNDAFAWKEGRLNFEKDDARQVFNKLSRWYGVEFQYDKKQLPELNYTGFYVNEDLETVLKGLSYSLRFSYQVEGKKVAIKFNQKPQ